MGNRTQRELHRPSGRSWRRNHAWCWNVEPTFAVTGEIYDEVQLDGTYLAHGWCLLLAVDGASGHVIAFQWCDSEKTAAWKALLEQIPPPKVVVIDGGSGLALALRDCWPQTRVQRCLVHVQRNIRRYLTMRPRTLAGKELRALSLTLTRITTRDQAVAWQVQLHAWHQQHAGLINAKTYLTQTGVRPMGVSSKATWWWTHERLRKAYQLLARLSQQEVLFTYLDEEFQGLGISWTTNRIEGGANAGIKDLLRRHRGMTSPHQRRAVEWWCYQHSPTPTPPATLIKPDHYQPPAKHAAPATKDEPAGPAAFDTGLTTEEGLYARKGWAGRSHPT